ncbi:hypothetical protein AB0C86_17715 [Streptomyces lavendulae]|uniref:hypothetical protein n=1 Tax=Streptomyces lavendulae TaxID=1914 RepID=UPI0024A35E42|nr:hypothetical protein [Streptomyces lavendulae]GLW01189.1 hypothetical protein Slala05_48200 [Streptomyces lavendulae subsp. lavendulae]
MITAAGPVGEWFWEPAPLVAPADGGALRALELLSDLAGVLASCGLVTGEGAGSVVLADRRVMGEPLFARRDLPPGAGLVAAAERADAVGLLPGRLLRLSLALAGEWREAAAVRRAERLFTLRVEVWGEGAVLVALSAYADAWMAVDLRGRPQPEVCGENAPRLAAALARICGATGAPVDPGDPTRYADPTAEGFADQGEAGAEHDDAWGTFEVPARWRRLMALLPGGFDGRDYESTTELPVRYARVRVGERVLGFLWASADGAAGYEPRSAAGDAAFGAGAVWLARLRSARLRGLGAPEALDGLLGAAAADGRHGGSAVEDVTREAASLDVLEELSGRS